MASLDIVKLLRRAVRLFGIHRCHSRALLSEQLLKFHHSPTTMGAHACLIATTPSSALRSPNSMATKTSSALSNSNSLHFSAHVNVRPVCHKMFSRLQSTQSTDEKYSLKNDPFRKYLQHLVTEYDLECEQIARNEFTMNERHVQLACITNKIRQLYKKTSEMDDISKLLAGLTEKDMEMKHLATEELAECRNESEKLEREIVELLTPAMTGDHTDVILELTAGVGGQEAMLFAGEIFDMYHNYAVMKGWSFQTLGHERNELGGVRRAAASISGVNVYKWLKFEGGVHRVQRVPQTEKSGRVHTSTMTVAILPQPTEIDITLNPKDLQIETCRASGKGGQHVNTTDSAVRIVHTPTGMFAECQEQRSQIKNKTTAMNVLKSRLYQKYLEEQVSQQQQARSFQVGTAGRSEKIRTYNFSQDRVTDHRLNHTIYNIERFMLGREELDTFIHKLLQGARLELFDEILTKFSTQQN